MFCIDLLVQVIKEYVREVLLPSVIVQGSDVCVCADIKGFLADVKPALLSALDAEYEKNPFEVCAFVYG